MNERIDQLLWAAGGYTKLNYPDDAFLDGRYALTQEQVEKFAELIVRECAGFINTEMSLGGVDGRSLLEHFGVEE